MTFFCGYHGDITVISLWDDPFDPFDPWLRSLPDLGQFASPALRRLSPGVEAEMFGDPSPNVTKVDRYRYHSLAIKKTYQKSFTQLKIWENEHMKKKRRHFAWKSMLRIGFPGHRLDFPTPERIVGAPSGGCWLDDPVAGYGIIEILEILSY